MKKPHLAAEPVSAYDAKTHLPQLLARAEKGDRFVITRHGKPVAQLLPIEPVGDAQAYDLLADIQINRQRLARAGLTSITDLVHDAHRY